MKKFVLPLIVFVATVVLWSCIDLKEGEVLPEEETVEAQFTTPIVPVGPRGIENAITVGKSGRCDYTTIASAIAAASSGDVVFVYPGDYAETIAMASGVDVWGMNTESVSVGMVTGLTDTAIMVTMADDCVLGNLTVKGKLQLMESGKYIEGIGIPATMDDASCTLTNVHVELAGQTVAVYSLRNLGDSVHIYMDNCDFYDTNSSPTAAQNFVSYGIYTTGETATYYVTNSKFNSIGTCFYPSRYSEAVFKNCEFLSSQICFSSNAADYECFVFDSKIKAKPIDTTLSSTYNVRPVGGSAQETSYVTYKNCEIILDLSGEDTEILNTTQYAVHCDECHTIVDGCSIYVYGADEITSVGMEQKPGGSPATIEAVYLLNSYIYLDGVGTQYSLFYDAPNAGHNAGAFYIGNSVYDVDAVNRTDGDTEYRHIGSGNFADTVTFSNSNAPDTTAIVYLDVDNDVWILDTQADTRDIQTMWWLAVEQMLVMMMKGRD